MNNRRRLLVLIASCGILVVTVAWWGSSRNRVAIEPVPSTNLISVAQDTNPEVFAVNSVIDEVCWEAESGRLGLLTRMTDDRGSKRRTVVVFSPDSNDVAELYSTGDVCWGLTQSQNEGAFYTGQWGSGPGGVCQVLCFDSTSGDEQFRLNGAPLEGLGVDFTSDPLTISTSANGRYLAAGTKLVDSRGYPGAHIGGEVCVWDLQTNELAWNNRVTHSDMVTSVAFSPDCQLLASGGDQLIRIWDAATGNLAQTLIGAGWHGITSIAFSPDGRHLATGGRGDEEGGVVRVWNLETGRVAHRIGAFSARANVTVSVVFGNDGRLFAVGPKLNSDSNEFRVHVWEPVTGNHLGMLAEGQGAPRAITVSPDSRQLAIGTYEGNLFLINVIDSTGITTP